MTQLQFVQTILATAFLLALTAGLMILRQKLLRHTYSCNCKSK